jgi:hypothetical protein
VREGKKSIKKKEKIISVFEEEKSGSGGKMKLNLLI